MPLGAPPNGGVVSLATAAPEEYGGKVEDLLIRRAGLDAPFEYCETGLVAVFGEP